MANEFTIKQGTTAQQIENFLTNDLNQDRKVLARHNEHGEVVLYEKPKARGAIDKLSAFVDRILGRTERREQRALDAIRGSLGKALDAAPETRARGLLTSRIETAIGHHTQQRAGMTAGVLSGLLLAVRSLPKETVKVTSESGSPSLQSLGMAPNDKAITDTAQLLSLDPENTGKLHKQLGDEILNKFVSGNPSPKDREAFALSDGIKLTLELREALKAALGAMDPAPTVDDYALDNLVADTFRYAASQVLSDKVIDQTELLKWTDKNGRTVEREMPHIELGGKQYKPTGFLGAGGFADVYEYASLDDPNSKIALKVTRDLEGANYLKESQESHREIDDYAKLVKSAGDEITLHQKAYGEGCKQIVGYSGHMRLPDGNVAVAMEIAPNGDVHSMGEKLTEAVKSGQLTVEEANILRLTLAKDMLRGLDFMHQQRGMTHFDFKSPNCFIGPDGTAKVGDFGLTIKMDETEGLDHTTDKVDNLAFKAPELVRSEDVMSRVKKLADETGQHLMKPFIEKLQHVLPGGPKVDNLVLAMARNVFSEPLEAIEDQARSDKSMLFFDRTVDVWGLGSSLLHMFTGKYVGDNKKSFDSHTDLIAFGANRNSQPLSDPIQITVSHNAPGPGGKGMIQVQEVVDVPQPGSIGLKTGDDQVDDLLTKMLMPDPRDRWSAGKLLDHPTLKTQGGVDSKEARDLIVALNSGDPEKISQARQALNALAPQTVSEDLVLTPEKLEEWTSGNKPMPPLPQTPTPGTDKSGGEDEKLSV